MQPTTFFMIVGFLAMVAAYYMALGNDAALKACLEHHSYSTCRSILR